MILKANNMKYIVWRTPYTSYDYPQGDGYFVKYKNKLSDEFSPNWFDAIKYKSIGPAVTRLGISLDKSMKSMDDFFKSNKMSKSYAREQKISSLLDEKQDKIIFFERGHIDKIDENGNYVGNAGEELLEFVEKYLKSNVKRFDSMKNKLSKLDIGNYIDTSIPDDEFWSGLINKNANG